VETLSGRIGSLSMILSVSPPGGDFTEPVTQACLRTAGSFLMLDTSLAHRRHYPAINWFQSYSLYQAEVTAHYRDKVSSEWEELVRRCRQILQQEETLREVAEIVGAEGLQDLDRLLMRIAERIRTEFLQQNAYSDDAFCPPEKILAIVSDIVGFFDRAAEKLKKGVPLEEAMNAAKQEGKGERPKTEGEGEQKLRSVI
jgi:V/A-type H+-transporting ATPase subunit A